MNLEKLTPESISRFIPNHLTEVAGEKSLFEKLMPFIQSAKLWMEAEYLGPDDFLSEAHNDYVLKIIVAKAFADAVPALDLVVTPTGMGVISTDSMAPASKERVERLIASMCDYVSVNLSLLIEICRTYESWRLSERGQYFCASFVSSLSVLLEFPADSRPNFSWVHDNAVLIEKELEMDYFGHNVMKFLRDKHNSGDRFYHEITDKILAAIVQFLLWKNQGRKHMISYWHLARPIIYDILMYPELEAMWRNDMEGVASMADFVNNLKGGFYF